MFENSKWVSVYNSKELEYFALLMYNASFTYLNVTILAVLTS